MKSLFLTAPQQLTWRETPTPQPGADEVLLQTTASAISIGTEIPQYRGDARSHSPAKYPIMTGYENVAQIIAVGKNMRDVEIGQRVIGFYGYRTHAVMSAKQLIFVPDDINDAQAILAILSCDVAKGIRKLQLTPEMSVLITGCGTIGLLATFLLLAYGVHDVTVVDPIAKRRNLALKLGARTALHPDEAMHNDVLYAAGLECSASQQAFALLQRKMQSHARIAVLSDGNRDPLQLLPDFHHKELTLYGSSDGWDYQQHAAWYFEMLRRRETSITDIFDTHITPDEIPTMFATLADHPVHAIKVLITGFVDFS